MVVVTLVFSVFNRKKLALQVLAAVTLLLLILILKIVLVKPNRPISIFEYLKASINMDETKAVWTMCDAVCFDVDSTLIVDEGLDELAEFLGKGEEIAALTNQAMGGNLTFREALEKRLDILQPSKFDVQNFINKQKLEFTEGVKELVKLLHSRGVDVYLVSGGFYSLIKPLARQLDIPLTNIYANRLRYKPGGSYAGFDKTEPTSAAGGKPKVAQFLKDTKGYKNLVFIGDGATDLEAYPPADAFIGFGGNVVRESVRSRANWFVYKFSDLINVYNRRRPSSAYA